MKTAIWILVVLVILGGGYYLYSRSAGSMGSAQENVAEGNADERRIMQPTIVWTFEDGGEKDNIPYTKVFVTVNGTLHSVGDFQGSCSQITETGGVDGKGLLAGELSAVQCWFAGGGDEIGIFAVETGGLELMVGALSEPIEDSEAFRGDFEIKPEFKFY
jgi:hypothetical protein